jgi:hypothetical protein
VLRWCPVCRQELPLDAFAKADLALTHFAGRCRACRAEERREWRLRNPDAIADYNRKQREKYRQAHPAPERPCIVCGKPFSNRPNALVCGAEVPAPAQARATASAEGSQMT